MSEKVKVLYFVDRMLKGGIQSLVIDIAKFINKKQFQLDFLLLDDGNEYELENTLKGYGCNIYKLKGVWLRQPIDFIKYRSKMKSFFKAHHNYKAVHLHSTSKNYLVLKYAKKYGIPIRIAHSHSVEFASDNIFKHMIGNLMKRSLKKYTTKFLACSENAGKWLFGEDIVNSSKFDIIKNGIDVNSFIFNEKIRKKMRRELNIDDNTLVIGNVGRFVRLKNHEFLIDIFCKIHEKINNVKLLLVGSGQLEEQIKNKVLKLGLQENVIFLGFKDTVNKYMYAMDLFIFPSMFEGLGMVLIEAQATGLKCYASKDVIPKEVQMSNSLEFISLKKTAQEWADIILNSNHNRTNVLKEMISNGYNIKETVKRLEKIYIN